MKKIKYLVMDVDGTLTDGKIYMGNDGEIMKAFDIKDGCGIHDLLPSIGVVPVIITGRKSKILENRCKEIGIDCLFQGVNDKVRELENFIMKRGCRFSEVAYIGDDINDLACMRIVKEEGGVVGCPYDAVDYVKDISDYLCQREGGNGAVREFVDWIIKNNLI